MLTSAQQSSIPSSRYQMMISKAQQNNYHLEMSQEFCVELGKAGFADICNSSLPQVQFDFDEEEQTYLQSFFVNGYIAANRWYSDKLHTGKFLPLQRIDYTKRRQELDMYVKSQYKGFKKALYDKYFSTVDAGSDNILSWFFEAGFGIALSDINQINETVATFQSMAN
jgi:hypothetical protein